MLYIIQECTEKNQSNFILIACNVWLSRRSYKLTGLAATGRVRTCEREEAPRNLKSELTSEPYRFREPPEQNSRNIKFGASWRAILLGTLLIIPNMYWILDSAGQGYPTTISLYFKRHFLRFLLSRVLTSSWYE